MLFKNTIFKLKKKLCLPLFPSGSERRFDEHFLWQQLQGTKNVQRMQTEMFAYDGIFSFLFFSTFSSVRGGERTEKTEGAADAGTISLLPSEWGETERSAVQRT
jgi:hypothetical protein